MTYPTTDKPSEQIEHSGTAHSVWFQSNWIVSFQPSLLLEPNHIGIIFIYWLGYNIQGMRLGIHVRGNENTLHTLFYCLHLIWSDCGLQYWGKPGWDWINCIRSWIELCTCRCFDGMNDGCYDFQDIVLKPRGMDCVASFAVRWATSCIYVANSSSDATQGRRRDIGMRGIRCQMTTMKALSRQ